MNKIPKLSVNMFKLCNSILMKLNERSIAPTDSSPVIAKKLKVKDHQVYSAVAKLVAVNRIVRAISNGERILQVNSGEPLTYEEYAGANKKSPNKAHGNKAKGILKGELTLEKVIDKVEENVDSITITIVGPAKGIAVFFENIKRGV